MLKSKYERYYEQIVNLNTRLKDRNDLGIKSVRDISKAIYPKDEKLDYTEHDLYDRYVKKTVRSLNKVLTKSNNHHAKILVFDIETSPLMAYCWGLWNQNISPTKQLLSDWFMLTWSAKWLFDDKVYSDKLTPEEALNEDDERITKSLWHLIDSADILISHNGLKFDNKKMRTRFIKHGLPAPSPTVTIDTLIHCRRQFAITSNKLDYIAKFFGFGGKMETGGFELWASCMKGDIEALHKMELYNIQDVKVLEDVYLKIRPYIKPHPNLGLFISENVRVCPSCASDEIEWLDKIYMTNVNVYDAFRCKSCGALGRSRNTKLDRDSKRFLTTPVAR